MGRASDSRSQADNKRMAFQRLLKTPVMRFWIDRKLYEIRQRETMDETVAKEAADENLRFEIKSPTGQWEEVSAEYFNGSAANEESSA